MMAPSRMFQETGPLANPNTDTDTNTNTNANPNINAPSRSISPPTVDEGYIPPPLPVGDIEEIIRDPMTALQNTSTDFSWSADNLAAITPGSTNLLYQTLLVHQPNELSAFFPTTEQRHQVSAASAVSGCAPPQATFTQF
jgi:hypothetical protein